MVAAQIDGRVRRARSLVVLFDGERLQVRNFITRRAFKCRPEWMAALTGLDDWKPAAEARELLVHAGVSGENIVERLVELGALVIEGSAGADIEQRYEEQWAWGVDAGLLHFGIREAEYVKLDQEGWDAIGKRRRGGGSEPAIFMPNDGFSPVVPLPEPSGDESAALTDVMLPRRSWRTFTSQAPTILDVAVCLNAGLRIVRTHRREPVGNVLFKITPSPGGRNPYEAYVYIRNVDGLEPGIYHYSASEHSLGRVAVAELPDLSDLLGGQEWAERAAFAVFLVCYFERLSWKYRHPNTYTATLLEAGHIMQNILLAATSRGLSGAPSNCFADTIIERTLGIPPVETACTYAAAFGFPDPEPAYPDYRFPPA